MPATVKTGMHRAQRQLCKALDQQLASTLTEAFPFDGKRCRQAAGKSLARPGLPTPPNAWRNSGGP